MNMTDTYAEILARQVLEFKYAMVKNADEWVPACNGTEMPTEIAGKRYQYCYNPFRREHRYYCLTDDLILEYNQLPSQLRGGYDDFIN